MFYETDIQLYSIKNVKNCIKGQMYKFVKLIDL